MRVAIVLLFLMTIAAPAHAATTPSYRLCNPDRIKQTNAWVDCLQKALDMAEEKLSAAARKIAAGMQAGDMLEEPTRTEMRALFDAAQKQWLSVRDQDCRAYGAHRPDSASAPRSFASHACWTKQRTGSTLSGRVTPTSSSSRRNLTVMRGRPRSPPSTAVGRQPVRPLRN
jgi:uncharacterized protein YecT (DUF1311 family)